MSAYSEVLVSPEGREVTARSAGEYNDLRYGRGYRPKVDEPPAKRTEKADKKPTKADSSPPDPK